MAASEERAASTIGSGGAVASSAISAKAEAGASAAEPFLGGNEVSSVSVSRASIIVVGVSGVTGGGSSAASPGSATGLSAAAFSPPYIQASGSAVSPAGTSLISFNCGSGCRDGIPVPDADETRRRGGGTNIWASYVLLALGLGKQTNAWASRVIRSVSSSGPWSW